MKNLICVGILLFSTPALAGSSLDWVMTYFTGTQEELDALEETQQRENLQPHLDALRRNAEEYSADFELYEAAQPSYLGNNMSIDFRNFVANLEFILEEEGIDLVRGEVQDILRQMGKNHARFAKIGGGPGNNQSSIDRYAVATYKFKKIYEKELQVDQAPFGVFNASTRTFSSR